MLPKNCVVFCLQSVNVGGSTKRNNWRLQCVTKSGDRYSGSVFYNSNLSLILFLSGLSVQPLIVSTIAFAVLHNYRHIHTDYFELNWSCDEKCAV